ncbi:hypothetical protein [Streptomyces sp. cmx-4-9]|uniref:hypothetical protein n=1 Tax=Streptomyces sp. cmx-4-9 TaxID=2790941 RepID=UPI00397ED0EF
MLRTLTMAAATAALLLPGGPLPVAEADGPAPQGPARWSAADAAAFWTARRMASAVPLPPDPGPAPDAAPAPAADPREPEEPQEPDPAGPAGPAGPAPEGPGEPGTDPAPPPSPSPSPSPSASREPVAARLPFAGPGVGQNFDGVPSVGRMYVMKGAGAYFCTASVVSSPGRNLVVSAGHCLLGSDARQVAFVPRYTRAKPQPYGLFPVLRTASGRAKVWIDPRYVSRGADRAATLDVAFAQVGPNAKGVPVETVVGGNRLVTGAGYTHGKITLIGHPSSAARPRVCVNRTTKFTSADPGIPGSFLRINCTGYPGGTSGGPFLNRYDARTGTGEVVGVIGGWKTGGDTADTSYSSYFGADIRRLYEKAVAGARQG